MSGSRSQRFDVIVAGGGVIGAATAERLARTTSRVLLVDRLAPSHDRGSSHGDGRIVRLTYPEAVYLQMAQRVFPAWRRLEQDGGETLVERSGSWECGSEDAPILHQLATGFDESRIAYRWLSAAESNRLFPQFHLEPGSAAIFQEDGGIVRASRAVSLLWRLAADRGAEVRSGTEITAIEPLPESVRLLTAAGERLEAARVVLAGGGWMPALLRRLGLDLPLLVSEETVVYLPVRGGRPDHRVGRMPTLIDYHGEHPFYALPQIDIPGVKIGWHRTGPAVDPDRRSPDGDAAQRILETIQNFAAARFPHLERQPVHRTTCLYTLTPDYHFVLDRHPSHPRILIAAGFSGHGFKFAPVVGECLAALARDDPPPVDLDLFRLDRLLRPETLQPRTGA